ncbi:DUF6401 family natural product biosynthesis protein [Dactylosporangium sp. NPDC049140]|uniref:DUF6401 family natural product biosynthesis protein n=1 Tax=Dactylosporangium sp. NPDC049140 TaxID=3155647 RepID=UPI0034022BEC
MNGCRSVVDGLVEALAQPLLLAKVDQRHGRPPPTPDSVNWADADWTVLRLVAVCHLADDADAF